LTCNFSSFSGVLPFERFDSNGGFFINRLKDNANPKILFLTWRTEVEFIPWKLGSPARFFSD